VLKDDKYNDSQCRNARKPAESLNGLRADN